MVKTFKAYLCGAIKDCTDSECKDWRNYAKKNLKCETYDPMRRDYRGKEVAEIKPIVEDDKQDIDNSNFVLVNFIKPSVGTCMEILYAWERKKIVVLVHHQKDESTLSPWLIYHSHVRFETLDKAINYINAKIAGQRPLSFYGKNN